MEKESIQPTANLKIFHLTSHKMKREKIENQRILSNQQINELINLHKPSKIKTFILKNHSLINYFRNYLSKGPLINKGSSNPKDFFNYHPSSFRHNLMTKKLSKVEVDKDQIDITESKSINMTLQAQLILFNNIKNCHIKKFSELNEETNYQQEIMRLNEFNILNCDINCHFAPPTSKRKKIFNLLNDKCSTSSKSELSQGNQKPKLGEDEATNLKDKDLSNFPTCKLADKQANYFQEIENIPDLSELEDDIENTMSKMFEQSDLVKFIPMTFKDEYNSCM